MGVGLGERPAPSGLPADHDDRKDPGLLNFDAFVFTTRGLEAFGLVLIEAQAHGLPIVYSDLSGVREVVGSAGVAYTPGDPRSLAVALDQLGRDVHRHKALSTAALHNARRFDIIATARQLRELTLRVTKPHTPKS
ncbi:MULTISPECIES: glycosyltransferase [unclassified Streptomyces]|uniref:glycosyltransferase n=1 Tax=unclassified Streptomyces TaxID=2593676 RepID=UPI00332D731D